ncbi:MAG TPA: membrane protein insertion efficiency factor YidD [Candidatus Angelobacter sp.]|nr:membrane protein insertion efficiency factor YidD [Candidatus Angelobacter sp.]
MSAVSAVRRALDATVGRLLRLALTGLIVGYRTLLSPLLGPRCRFHPSCSTYALEAIRVHGAGKGTVLATWRVCRCNPWNAGGVDRVPDKGRWTPEPYVSLERGPVADPGTDTTRPDRTTDDRSAA